MDGIGKEDLDSCVREGNDRSVGGSCAQVMTAAAAAAFLVGQALKDFIPLGRFLFYLPPKEDGIHRAEGMLIILERPGSGCI